MNNEAIGIRIGKGLLKEIDTAIKNNPAIYNTRTHFIRAACIRELERLNKK